MKKNLNYKPTIILGMHDAIVSLTGLIAGLFFAFTDTNIIIISCIVSSISASLSMGAANYLAVKSVGNKKAIIHAFFTFISYMITCILLILPFMVFNDKNIALTSVFIMVIFIIFSFNLFFYYKNGFYKHFFEMLSICVIVSIVAFLIGEITHDIFGI